jgi:hypothetical protein
MIKLLKNFHLGIFYLPNLQKAICQKKEEKGTIICTKIICNCASVDTNFIENIEFTNL